jgi:glutathione S-transferase
MNITLHEYAPSGNCYKLRLLMAQLGLAYQRREYNILNGESRTPEFLSTINANGRIPVLEIDGQFIPESNAALWYLSEDTSFAPATKFDRADALHWMFFEQYNHEPNIATVRYWLTYGGGLEKMTEWQKSSLPLKIEQGYAALGVMEKRLSHHPFLIADVYSVADIALYAYTHVAGDGGFDLSRYPAILSWMARVAAQPGHVLIGD